MWKVPLFNIQFQDDEKAAVQRVLDSGWITMGAVTQEFESAFARFIGVKHAIAVNSCTAGLHLANRAMGIGPGDEVICPSLTFVAGANSILYCGAKPVFADITSENDLTIDPDSIASRITSRTKAIQVMHYAGYPCAMEAILEVANTHRLVVIEDAAHAPGAQINGKKCGTWGHVGCFSFFSNKNMTTIEGGMVVTDSDELAETIRRMRSHGMTTLTLDRHKGHAFSYDVVCEGYNYRIDEIRSALGLAQLQKLPGFQQKREHLTQYYRDQLRDVECLTVPFDHHPGRSAYHIFPVLLKDGSLRRIFMQSLKDKGIQTSIHYQPIHLFSRFQGEFAGLAGGMENLMRTEAAASRLVTLPLYPSMTTDDVDYVCEAVRTFECQEIRV